MAVGLQVDALSGGVGGHENAHILHGGVGVETGPDVLTLLDRRRAADHGQAFAVALLVQHRDDPIEGVRVLGKDDDPLIAPRTPVWSADGIEHGYEGLEAGVGAGLVSPGPAGQFLKLLPSSGGERIRGPGGQQRVQLRLGDQALLLVGLPRAHDLRVIVVVLIVEYAAAHGLVEVVLQGLGKGPGAGQETFLEQQGRDVEVAPPLSAPGAAQQRVQLGVGALLVAGGLVREHLDPATAEVLVGDLRLQAAHRHLVQSGGIDAGATGEATRIDHLQQGSEGLGVAVVGCGGQEQAVLALVRQAPQRPGTLGVNCIPASATHSRGRRRGHVVRLVDDQHIEGVGTGRVRACSVGQDLPQQPLGAHTW